MGDLKKLRRSKRYAELKEKFERASSLARSGRKTRASFDEWLDAFVTLGSQVAVANRFGISTEAVRVKYNRYFESLLGPWRAQPAYKQRPLRSPERDRKHAAWEQEIAERHKPFAEYVTSSGLSLTPITRLQGRRLWSRAKEAMAGKVRCRLIYSKSVWHPDPNDSPRLHLQVLPADRNRDGIIFIAEPEGHPRRRFFFPTHALNPPERGQRHLYIPFVTDREYERRKPLYHYDYDFWLDYEEEKGIKALIELSEKLKGR